MDVISALQDTNIPPAPPAIVQCATQQGTNLNIATFGERRYKPGADSTFHAVVQSSFLNRWATDAGFLIGEGPVLQNLIAVDFGKIGAFVWNNMDFSKGGETHEIDIGSSYKLLTRTLGGKDLSLTVGAQAWFYPSELLSANSTYDALATATVSWNGPLNLTLDYKHLFSGQSTENSGELLVLKAARREPLYHFSGGSSVSLKIDTQLPLRHNFFLKETLGIPCVRGGVGIEWSDSKGKWQIEFHGRYQYGLDGRTEDQPIYGFSIKHLW